MRAGAREATGAVIECVWDKAWRTVVPTKDPDNPRVAQGGWRFERTRSDKRMPNAKKTVVLVKETIEDNISVEELSRRLGRGLEEAEA